MTEEATDPAETWEWTDYQLEFLQLVEQNQAREQELMASGAQLQVIPMIFNRIDSLAEFVLTEEGYEQYHMEFAIRIKEQIDMMEAEVNKRKILADTDVDISRLPRGERRRQARLQVKQQFRQDGDNGLLRPN